MDRLSDDCELQVFAVSDVGLVRSRNEDMIVVNGELVRDDSCSVKVRPSELNGGVLFGVADGVGGAAAGDEASSLVAQRLADAAAELPAGLRDGQVKSRIDEAAFAAHRELETLGRRDPDHAGMATTFAGVLVYGARLFYLNAGDSRVYRINRTGLTQLSRDHSLRELTGNSSIPSNIIANCFGAESEFYIDVVRVNDTVEKGDGFLVCSDGLSDLVDDGEMEGLLSESSSLQDAGRRMVDRAKGYGGRDNISVILVAAQ